MSTRFAGVAADYIAYQNYVPGERIGEDDALPPHTYAVALCYDDDVFYIMGTPEQFDYVIERIQKQRDLIRQHAARPLNIDDFYVDEDHDFVCPRCSTSFSLGEIESYRQLRSVLSEHAGEHNTHVQ